MEDGSVPHTSFKALLECNASKKTRLIAVHHSTYLQKAPDKKESNC